MELPPVVVTVIKRLIVAGLSAGVLFLNRKFGWNLDGSGLTEVIMDLVMSFLLVHLGSKATSAPVVVAPKTLGEAQTIIKEALKAKEVPK